jgi:hypothetical protein
MPEGPQLAVQRPIIGPEAAVQPEKPAVASNGRSRHKPPHTTDRCQVAYLMTNV